MDTPKCFLHGENTSPLCRLCWLAANDESYRQLFEAVNLSAPIKWARTHPEPCHHLGAQVGLRECKPCAGKMKYKVFVCGKGHGDVTMVDCQTRNGGRQCEDYEAKPKNSGDHGNVDQRTAPQTDGQRFA